MLQRCKKCKNQSPKTCRNNEFMIIMQEWNTLEWSGFGTEHRNNVKPYNLWYEPNPTYKFGELVLSEKSIKASPSVKFLRNSDLLERKNMPPTKDFWQI